MFPTLRWRRETLLLVCFFEALVCVVSGASGGYDTSFCAEADHIRAMFTEAYDAYMEHAFPHDELNPIHCTGYDTWGKYALTLVDSLDMLLVLGNVTEFNRALRLLLGPRYTKSLPLAADRRSTFELRTAFDRDLNVSVFETNIRVVGGLLSAHLLATAVRDGELNPAASSCPPPAHERLPGSVEAAALLDWYDEELLELSVSVAQRLLPAFDTPSGIPFGTVNFVHGVPHMETPITCTAGGGTFALEFGLLSRLTGDSRFEDAAMRALRGLRRSADRNKSGLVGNHINTTSESWTYQDAGIGHGIDSYYEYMIKAYVLLGDIEYLEHFWAEYPSVMKYMKAGAWFFEVNPTQVPPPLSQPRFNGLQCFWPGMQTLIGDLAAADLTANGFAALSMQWGLTPEKLNLITGRPEDAHYALRPELVESIYHLSRTFRDEPEYPEFAAKFATNLDAFARVQSGGGCAFAAVKSLMADQRVPSEAQPGQWRAPYMERMDSFFLAETLKYLFLTFDRNNWVNLGNYVFTTEAHILPVQGERASATLTRKSDLAAERLECAATGLSHPLPHAFDWSGQGKAFFSHNRCEKFIEVKSPSPPPPSLSPEIVQALLKAVTPQSVSLPRDAAAHLRSLFESMANEGHP